MAQNNALAVATLVMADERTTGQVFPTDKLETLCNIYKVSFNIVNQILDEAKEGVKEAIDFGTDATIAIAIAKAKDIDDDDLKEATEAYANYVNAVNKLKDKYNSEVADFRVNMQETINKLRNPDM
jgi:hypothetical protein|nr:MAG TPA: hypothetical protein [Caudoviricetes sp.]